MEEVATLASGARARARPYPPEGTPPGLGHGGQFTQSVSRSFCRKGAAGPGRPRAGQGVRADGRVAADGDRQRTECSGHARQWAHCAQRRGSEQRCTGQEPEVPPPLVLVAPAEQQAQTPQTGQGGGGAGAGGSSPGRAARAFLLGHRRGRDSGTQLSHAVGRVSSRGAAAWALREGAARAWL